MRFFMGVFGLGQVWVRTLWVKSVRSAHWLVRQWVISVTELSLDLGDKWQKWGRSHHCFWKSELWFRQDNESEICEKEFFVHFGCRRIWSSLFEQVLLESLEYSTSCNTQVTLDWTQGALNLGPSVYGLNKHGRPAWSVCTSWGMVLQKSLFVSFLPNIYRATRRYRRGTMMHW